MNNALVLHLCDAFAARLVARGRASPRPAGRPRLPAGSWQAAPSPDEQAQAVKVVEPFRTPGTHAGPVQLQRVPLLRLTGGREAAMDRREFFSWARGGLAGAASMTLLLRDGTLQAGVPGEASPRCPHFAPRATRAMHICLCGAMSHVDTFDYKPGLIAAHGKSLNSPTKPDVFFGQVGRLRRPDWAFRKRGQSGLWVSDLFPHLGEMADELTVIRSMVAETSNHTPATFQENSGFRLERLPFGGSLAELWAGERVRRPAGLRGDPGRSRVSGRRLDQLDKRLPAGAAPGRGDPAARKADRRPVPGPRRSIPIPSRARASWSLR